MYIKREKKIKEYEERAKKLYDEIKPIFLKHYPEYKPYDSIEKGEIESIIITVIRDNMFEGFNTISIDMMKWLQFLHVEIERVKTLIKVSLTINDNDLSEISRKMIEDYNKMIKELIEYEKEK